MPSVWMVVAPPGAEGGTTYTSEMWAVDRTSAATAAASAISAMSTLGAASGSRMLTSHRASPSYSLHAPLRRCSTVVHS